MANHLVRYHNLVWGLGRWQPHLHWSKGTWFCGPLWVGCWPLLWHRLWRRLWFEVRDELGLGLGSCWAQPSPHVCVKLCFLLTGKCLNLVNYRVETSDYCCRAMGFDTYNTRPSAVTYRIKLYGIIPPGLIPSPTSVKSRRHYISFSALWNIY